MFLPHRSVLAQVSLLGIPHSVEVIVKITYRRGKEGKKGHF